jgi:hypothetical protein
VTETDKGEMVMKEEFVPTKAQCKFVSKAGDEDRSLSASGTYGLYEGNLYALGKHGYLAGAVWGTDRGSFLVAVDAAEEEMAYLMADAKAEFGF